MNFWKGLWDYLWPAAVAYALFALLVLCLATLARAAPQDAVVRLPSHGASATVIYSVPGRTLILGCAHAFEGADRDKPIAIDAPSPSPGAVIRPGIRLLAVDAQLDLSLVEMNTGPLPYVAPVAPAGHRPGNCLSVGYDEMKLPPTVRRATILSSDRRTTWTREKPWHGRSGGALLDADTGQLVGVVSGYSEPDGSQRRAETTPQGRGIYVSHEAILKFIGWKSAPRVAEFTEPAPGRPWVSESLEPGCPPGGT